MYLLLAFQLSSNFLSTISFPLAAIAAAFPSFPVLLSEKILKRFCNKWGYSRFRIIQNFAKLLLAVSLAVTIGLVLGELFYGNLPIWTPFLAFGFAAIMYYAIPFLDFFNLTGVSVLYFKLFLKDLQRKSDNANFRRLSSGARKVTRIAKAYNMRIPPCTLATGMTISFLENRKTIHQELSNLIEWIENPIDQENFKKFHKLVKKYNSIAKKASEEGIEEISSWTFEKAIEVCKAIVTPVAVAIIIIIVPKILEIIGLIQ